MKGQKSVVFFLFVILFLAFGLKNTSAATCSELCEGYKENHVSTPYTNFCSLTQPCVYNYVDKGVTSDAQPGEDCLCFDSYSCTSCATCTDHGCVQGVCTPDNCTSLNWNCGSGFEPNCNSWIHCGKTPPGESCVNHHTANPCISSSCESMGWECGYGLDTNCEREINCGNCPSGEYCVNHTCTTNCTPDCNNKECGVDGCGGFCGYCSSDKICFNYHCEDGLTCSDYSKMLGYEHGYCSSWDYSNDFCGSETTCYGTTSCYYGGETQNNENILCDKICWSYNRTDNCGSTSAECENKCHPWGCCELNGATCTNNEDCCSNYCDNNICATPVECVDDSDCSEANGYPPHWFCDNNECLNGCLGGAWITSGQPEQSYDVNTWGYTDTVTEECCGDQTLENYENRKTNCSSNCETDDYPSFLADSSDGVCCNSSFSCVKSGLCYSSINHGSTNIDINGEELICNESVWYDCDTAQNYCKNYCIDKWSKAGETNVGEYNSLSKEECCGDDSNEVYVDSSSFKGHSASDKACCNNKDCVLNGICYNSNYTGGHETNCYDSIDNDCNGKTDFCDGRYPLPGCDNKGLDPSCGAKIQGTIIDTYNQRVVGAHVKVLTVFKYKTFKQPISFDTTTDSNGDYSLTIYGNSNYDVVVTKKGYYMTANESKHVDLGEVWDLDMRMAKKEECNPDCTKRFDKLCFASCNGKNGCKFYNQKTMNLCDAQGKYFIKDYNSTYEVECCEGSPRKKLPSKKPTIKVDATTIVRVSKPVLYRGKLVNMIILVVK